MALTGAGTAVIRRVVDIVSAATLGPRSAGVLFLDMDPQVLRVIAERIVEDFASLPGRRIVTLGPWANDTDLWVAGTFAADGIGLEPGLLAERPYRKPAVVVVPDLAAAGVSVQRAAIAVLDTSVAYVERSGRSMRWKPTCLWLAAVSREDAAHLSPHLLDRFPYRVDAAGMDEELRARYRENAAAPAADDWASAIPLFHADTIAVLPAMTDAATRRIVEAVPAGP
ncbi:MAG: hypothetical protein HOV68_00710, partial [Streptomycetaceae bacterium]|nr:hypothetical protein [Streptomycetaceae bacterium]